MVAGPEISRLLWIICFLCLVFLMLSRLFIAALWSPAGKGLTSCFFFFNVYCIFVTFSCGILVLLWYLIVSFPDLCHLSYFVGEFLALSGNQQSKKRQTHHEETFLSREIS